MTPFVLLFVQVSCTNGGALKLDRDNLIRARERRGFAIETVAEKAGIAKNSVLRAEHGEHIRPLTARKIAGALGVEVADLYADAHDPKEDAPPWLEPTFNDAIRERRFFRFADAFDAAADRWTARTAESTTEDAELWGLITAVLDLYQFISENITRREWEALTTDEQDELRRVMDKLARVAADGYLRLKASGYIDEQTATLHREMMRRWTERISA
jgi:transcriptional regulator with XRE-family HTH domain